MTVDTLDQGSLERDIAAILGIADAPSSAAVPAPASLGRGLRRFTVPAALLVAATGAGALIWLGMPAGYRPAPIEREATIAREVRTPLPNPDARARVAIAAPRDQPRPAADAPRPLRTAREDEAPAVPRRAAPRPRHVPPAAAAGPVETRTADAQPSAPEPGAGSVAEAAPVVRPDAQIALAANIAPPPPVIAPPPPVEEPSPAKRLKTQRSIDAIRLLRRQ